MYQGLSGPQFLQIITSVLEEVNKNQGEDFYKARLHGVILSALYYKQEQTCQYMKEKGILLTFIKTTIERTHYFELEYDRRLLILGLISFFKYVCKDGITPDNQKIAIEIMGAISHNLFMKQIEASKYAKSVNKLRFAEEKRDYSVYSNLRMSYAQKVDVHLSPEDLEQEELSPDDDIYAFLVNKNTKSQLPLINLETPVQAIDEFKEFQNVFHKIKVRSC